MSGGWRVGQQREEEGGRRPHLLQTPAHQAAGERKNLTSLNLPLTLLNPPGRAHPSPLSTPALSIVGTYDRVRAAPCCLHMELKAHRHQLPALGAALRGGLMWVPPHQRGFRGRGRMLALPECPGSKGTAPRWLCPSDTQPAVGWEREKQIPSCCHGLAEGS